MDDPPSAMSRFGRPRFGGGARTLLLACLGAGLLAATALAGVIAWLTPSPGTWAAAAAALLASLPAFTMFAWSLVVDPRSVTVPAHPEDSVESNWLQRAATGAFSDLLVLSAVATAVLAWLEPPVSPSLLIGCVPIVGLLCFGIRYLTLSRRNG